jgi:hypothetical protein
MAVDQEYTTQHLLAAAVNRLLLSIGELPIENEDEIEDILEARLAKQVLIDTKMQVLAYGFNFNKELDVPFIPDLNGNIPIPANVLSLHNADGITIKDWMLYDVENKTRIFTDTVLCDVIWNTDFNNLQYAVRNYITVKAARIFQSKMIGDKVMYTIDEKDEQDAILLLRQYEGFSESLNMLSFSDISVLGN